MEFDFIFVLNHGTHDSLVDFSVVQVDADFVADLELTVIRRTFPQPARSCVGLMFQVGVATLPSISSLTL